MAENSEDKPIHSAARSILDCFASIGASHFDVILTTRSSKKDRFRLGLIAAQDPEPTVQPPTRSRPSSGLRKWPSYERCLERAPGKPGLARRKPSRHRGFHLVANWGWLVEEIAA